MKCPTPPCFEPDMQLNSRCWFESALMSELFTTAYIPAPRGETVHQLCKFYIALYIIYCANCMPTGENWERSQKKNCCFNLWFMDLDYVCPLSKHVCDIDAHWLSSCCLNFIHCTSLHVATYVLTTHFEHQWKTSLIPRPSIVVLPRPGNETSGRWCEIQIQEQQIALPITFMTTVAVPLRPRASVALHMWVPESTERSPCLVTFCVFLPLTKQLCAQVELQL